MSSELAALNLRIIEALQNLPAADPFTVIADGADSDGDASVRRIVRDVCGSRPPEVLARMEAEYFGAGPLESLLTESSVSEIIINGPQSIWCERQGRLSRWDDCFLSDLTYRNFLARLCREAGMQASLASPFADGHWRDCRAHLAMPPASGEKPLLTLRRHPAIPWTFDELASRNWARPEALVELKKLVETRQNFLVIGGTGCGKTSALNACLMAIGPAERTVIIEDTSELRVPNEASTKLLTRRDPHQILREIDQSELVRQALRMRPDRLVMGEIRGGEAKDLLMAFATGHSGCMGTLHAETARQALLRLEMLIQLGAPQWSLHAVRTLIWLSVNAVVVIAKDREGARRLEGVYRIASLEDIGFLIEKTA